MKKTIIVLMLLMIAGPLEALSQTKLITYANQAITPDSSLTEMFKTKNIVRFSVENLDITKIIRPAPLAHFDDFRIHFSFNKKNKNITLIHLMYHKVGQPVDQKGKDIKRQYLMETPGGRELIEKLEQLVTEYEHQEQRMGFLKKQAVMKKTNIDEKLTAPKSSL